MYHHMILMCSDFSSGKRIAFHESYERISDSIDFKKIVDIYKKKFTTIKFSFHHIETFEKSYISVGEYDNYFRDVEFYSDLQLFEESVKKTTEITPEDIAKYMLTKKEFDKLQLQKLLFLTYSEYIIKHDKPLFSDEFEAWQYGPLIPKLHEELSNYKYEKVRLKDVELEKIKLKLKFSKIGDIEDILECADSVIRKYGEKTGGNLIDITHVKQGPWDIVMKRDGLYSKIPWQLVRDCAKV